MLKVTFLELFERLCLDRGAQFTELRAKMARRWFEEHGSVADDVLKQAFGQLGEIDGSRFPSRGDFAHAISRIRAQQATTAETRTYTRDDEEEGSETQRERGRVALQVIVEGVRMKTEPEALGTIVERVMAGHPPTFPNETKRSEC